MGWGEGGEGGGRVVGFNGEYSFKASNNLNLQNFFA